MNLFKIDAPKRLVYGFASVTMQADGQPLTDLHGDVIDVAHLEDASHSFMMRYRAAGEMHVGDAIATVVESIVYTEEKLAAMGVPADVAKSLHGKWWVGLKVHDDAVFERVRSGQLKMFSIQGRGRRVPLEV